jgi:hypothetical protein
LEKNTIKSIKYKAESIKVKPSSQEEWRVVDKVCRALMLGKQEKEKLKYQKYRHLDLSNIKLIEMSALRLREISSWVKEFRNLQVLNL